MPYLTGTQTTLFTSLTHTHLEPRTMPTGRPGKGLVNASLIPALTFRLECPDVVTLILGTKVLVTPANVSRVPHPSVDLSLIDSRSREV